MTNSAIALQKELTFNGNTYNLNNSKQVVDVINLAGRNYKAARKALNILSIRAVYLASVDGGCNIRPLRELFKALARPSVEISADQKKLQVYVQDMLHGLVAAKDWSKRELSNFDYVEKSRKAMKKRNLKAAFDASVGMFDYAKSKGNGSGSSDKAAITAQQIDGLTPKIEKEIARIKGIAASGDEAADVSAINGLHMALAGVAGKILTSKEIADVAFDYCSKADLKKLQADIAVLLSDESSESPADAESEPAEPDASLTTAEAAAELMREAEQTANVA